MLITLSFTLAFINKTRQDRNSDLDLGFLSNVVGKAIELNARNPGSGFGPDKNFFLPSMSQQFLQNLVNLGGSLKSYKITHIALFNFNAEIHL